MSIEHLAIIASVAVAVGSLYFGFRRNKREERAQVNDDAETTLTLLREQNSLLIEQNERQAEAGRKREEEWNKREHEWKQERKALNARIDGLDRDYRNLVLTVTTMGFCANAATCANYNPGDRRVRNVGGQPADG